MTRRVPVVIAMLTLAMAVPIRSASAEPILIASGSVVIIGLSTGATAHLHGTQHFTADPVFFGTITGGFLCTPCGPAGAAIGLDARMDTVDGGGTVKLDDRSWSLGSIGGVPNTAVLLLQAMAGAVIAPPRSAHATLSAPFELAGSSLFTWDENGEGTQFPIAGRGRATLELVPNPFLSDLWEFGSLRYDFQPVPEPATLLLVGSGVLALGAHRRRRGFGRRSYATGFNTV